MRKEKAEDKVQCKQGTIAGKNKANEKRKSWQSAVQAKNHGGEKGKAMYVASSHLTHLLLYLTIAFADHLPPA
jgi:hypothetical protein